MFVFNLFGDYANALVVNYILTKPLKEYYTKFSKRATNKDKIIIFMADGKVSSWGLCDRLKGILSTYKYCEENNIDFKIHFTHPFLLSDFLLPNKINWEINSNEISYNCRDSKPFKMAFISNSRDITPEVISIMSNIQKQCLKKEYKQLHVYTNMQLVASQFSTYFHKLFKLDLELQKQIDFHIKNIDVEYVAVQFRFLELLGDFNDDGGDDTVSCNDSDKQKKLIQSSLEAIRDIKKNNPEIEKILVASDSKTFIAEVISLNYVYIVPGEIGHSGMVSAKNINMKTFVDLFMLANALKIYSVIIPPMRNSKYGFAECASLINNVPFEQIVYNH